MALVLFVSSLLALVVRRKFNQVRRRRLVRSWILAGPENRIIQKFRKVLYSSRRRRVRPDE